MITKWKHTQPLGEKKENTESNHQSTNILKCTLVLCVNPKGSCFLKGLYNMLVDHGIIILIYFTQKL